MPLKREKKTVLEKQAREFVINLRDYFEREQQNGGPLLPVSRVCDRVSEALGIGRNTVTRITREKFGQSGMEDNVLVTPNKIRGKRKCKKLYKSSNSDTDPKYIDVPSSPSICDSESTTDFAVSGIKSKHPREISMCVISGKSTQPSIDLKDPEIQFNEELEDNIVIVVHPMFDDQHRNGRNRR